MAVWHDLTIGKIFNKVAEEFNMTPTEVKDLYAGYYEFAAAGVSSGYMPDINIFGFGRFAPNMKQLRVMKKKCDKGLIPDCDYCDKIEMMIRRKDEEKLKRKRKK